MAAALPPCLSNEHARSRRPAHRTVVVFEKTNPASTLAEESLTEAFTESVIRRRFWTGEVIRSRFLTKDLQSRDAGGATGTASSFFPTDLRATNAPSRGRATRAASSPSKKPLGAAGRNNCLDLPRCRPAKYPRPKLAMKARLTPALFPSRSTRARRRETQAREKPINELVDPDAGDGRPSCVRESSIFSIDFSVSEAVMATEFPGSWKNYNRRVPFYRKRGVRRTVVVVIPGATGMGPRELRIVGGIIRVTRHPSEFLAFTRNHGRRPFLCTPASFTRHSRRKAKNSGGGRRLDISEGPTVPVGQSGT